MRRKKPRPVEEHEAGGETERVFHEIRQIVRVSGVSLSFRALATFEKSFPMVWDALRPNVESRAFEEMADELRREAVAIAQALPRGATPPEPELGESQRYRLSAALDLYHYVNPKLLAFTAALRLSLRGELRGAAAEGSLPGAANEQIARGIPASMHPLEMASEDQDDPELQAIFDDVRKSHAQPQVAGEYRTMALWPEYLGRAWQRLKPLSRTQEYGRAVEALRDLARRLASSLPHRVDLSPGRLASEKDHDAVMEVADRFERLLPSLVLNIALLTLERMAPEVAQASPFPARFHSLHGGGSS
jgi:hypothetical protein